MITTIHTCDNCEQVVESKHLHKIVIAVHDPIGSNLNHRLFLKDYTKDFCEDCLTKLEFITQRHLTPVEPPPNLLDALRELVREELEQHINP